MATLAYLWSERAKFPIGSKQFIRAWGKRLFSLTELVKRNLRRSKLVRQGAIIHETAEIGKSILEGNKKHLTVGPFSFIGKVNMSLHDQIIIGERVCINDGVRILTGSHDISDPKWALTKKRIVIDDYVWIGMGAIILPGIHIGKGAVVGAGSVVSKSVSPNTIVVGNPARPISKTRCKELSYNPCEFLAANRAWIIG